MIGLTVTFIRQKERYKGIGQPQIVNEEYTGKVLDKIIGWEWVDGRKRRANFYLVQLPGGIIGKFFCDEAVRVVEDQLTV